MLTAFPVEGIGEISPGFDLAQAVVEGLSARSSDETTTPGPGALRSGDVLVIAHKAISKSEGRTRRLSEVEPSPHALELAGALEKDPTTALSVPTAASTPPTSRGRTPC